MSVSLSACAHSALHQVDNFLGGDILLVVQDFNACFVGEKSFSEVYMKEITLKVEGMQCGMCESHVNDAVRKAANVKKVTSSHAEGKTVVVCDDKVDVETIKNAIQKDGYRVGEVSVKPYEKRGLFSFFKK